MSKIRVAVTQLNAELGNVGANFKKSKDLIVQAAEKKVEYLVLPEFFTSPIAINDEIERVARKNREQKIIEKIKELSSKYSMVISGSLLNIIGRNIYNSMILVHPNGRIYIHNKDIPTQFENAYYTNGDNTRHFRGVGLALCWEMLRTRTIIELSDNVDFVLAASCWWDLPSNSTNRKLLKYNRELNRNAPREFAKLLGVPVFHSSHVGTVTGRRNLESDDIVERKLIGTSQIIDETGSMINEIEDENDDAVLVETIGLKRERSKPLTQDSFWLKELPQPYLDAWERENKLGKQLYERNRIRMIGKSL